jgi:hypothetical protein
LSSQDEHALSQKTNPSAEAGRMTPKSPGINTTQRGMGMQSAAVQQQANDDETKQPTRQGDKMELQKNDKVRISGSMFSEETITLLGGFVPTEGRVLRVNKKTYSIGFMTPNCPYESYLLAPRDGNGIERI